MKKFLAVLLALTMVLATGIMVSAVEEVESIEFKKVVTGNGNPAEKFTFVVGEGEVKEGSATANEVPVINNFDIEVEMGEGGASYHIPIPNFTKVGRYEYPLSEEDGTTAGMTYDTGEYTLVFIVVHGDNGLEVRPSIINPNEKKSKDFEITNTYKSGGLTVKKELVGNLVDEDDEFEIKVTLTGPESKTFKTDGIDWGTGADVETGGKSATYTLKGNEDFTIQNIPEGVSYKVEELNAEAFTPIYVVSYDGATGAMTENGATATITNTRGTDIDTGISLDNLPYIMTMVLALGGLVLFVVRKRRLN